MYINVPFLNKAKYITATETTFTRAYCTLDVYTPIVYTVHTVPPDTPLYQPHPLVLIQFCSDRRPAIPPHDRWKSGEMAVSDNRTQDALSQRAGRMRAAHSRNACMHAGITACPPPNRVQPA
jgi:hypothetical protein